MGRPLIYICAVTIIVLGVVQINLNERHISLINRTASYANGAEVRNLAHAGIEFTLHELRDDVSWRNSGNPYPVDLDYGTAHVTIEDETVNASLEERQLLLISNATLQGEESLIKYLVEFLLPPLPNIPGALSLTDPNFLTDLGGSFYINGLDESGRDTVGLPGISVIDQESKDQIIAEDPDYQFLDQVDGSTSTGDEPSLEVDPTMDFAPFLEMIETLAPTATNLSGGPYNDDLGSPEDPGVFLIDDYAKVSGNTNGYGILIVRENADLDIETTLDAAGTFNFYGLVLFENSWALDGQGDVTLHGSVIVGSDDESTPETTTIDLTGNLSILYNSEALDYARQAASKGMASRFKILDIYE